jgi:hypothetical protein
MRFSPPPRTRFLALFLPLLSPASLLAMDSTASNPHGYQRNPDGTVTTMP